MQYFLFFIVIKQYIHFPEHNIDNSALNVIVCYMSEGNLSHMLHIIQNLCVFLS